MGVRQVSKSTIAQGNPKGSKAWDQSSSTAFAAELLIVGGGGGGSGDGCYSGGGGGGQTRDLSITIGLAQTYAITIGAGSHASQAGSSTAFGYTAIGGYSSTGQRGGTSGNGYGGGNGAFCSGCCAAGDVAGGSGIVRVMYLGSAMGTGGTITSAGGYTYHTFTSNGSLVT
jgi:hypothetical protein